MTEAEERQKKAMALLEYYESKQAYALLRYEAKQKGEVLESTGKILQDDPIRIDNREGSLPLYKDVFELAEKLRKAEQDLAERTDLVRRLGFDV